MMLIALALAVVIAAAASVRELTPETDLLHDDKPVASAAGLPPDSPDGPETAYSSMSARELVVEVVPSAAPVPPFRRRQRSAGHNWWAAQMANGNGRDAAWMVAATEPARAQEA